MADTAQLGLPLLAAAQAQKHVTVNEALLRIDALARLSVKSAALSAPPGSAEEGAAYIVGTGAGGAWAGRERQVAIRINGGWGFAAARRGWVALDEVSGVPLCFDGVDWVAGALLASPAGAATLQRIVELDHVIATGASSATVAVIPSGSSVLGVTARVIAAVTGSATAWSLGVSGAVNRYGSGLGKARNSWASGLTGAPVAYYADTALLLTAEGGVFAGGTVRLAVHLMQLRPPRAI